MKALTFAAIFLVTVNAWAGDVLGLSCSIDVGGKRLEVSYSGHKSRMHLTRSGDGALLGSSYDGRLTITIDGVEILNRKTDAAAEEYGVVIREDRMVYANLSVEDSDGIFSNEEFFFVTFGQSLDQEGQHYVTDSRLSEMGGGNRFPKTHKASCRSY